MTHTGYSSADLRDCSYEHLSTRIKDKLVHTACPIATLDISIRQCQAKREREKKHTRTTIGTVAVQHPSPNISIPFTPPVAGWPGGHGHWCCLHSQRVHVTHAQQVFWMWVHHPCKERWEPWARPMPLLQVCRTPGDGLYGQVPRQVEGSESCGHRRRGGIRQWSIRHTVAGIGGRGCCSCLDNSLHVGWTAKDAGWADSHVAWAGFLNWACMKAAMLLPDKVCILKKDFYVILDPPFCDRNRSCIVPELKLLDSYFRIPISLRGQNHNAFIAATVWWTVGPLPYSSAINFSKRIEFAPILLNRRFLSSTLIDLKIVWGESLVLPVSSSR